MTEERTKEHGWIEIIYGDYWTKRKKLIIAGFFMPLFFAFLTFIEFFYIFTHLYGVQTTSKSLFLEIITKINAKLFGALFLSSVFLFLLIMVYFDYSFSSALKSLLKKTWQEIYEERKANPKAILVKNMLITVVRWFTERLNFILLLPFLYILAILSIFVGYLTYVYLGLFLIPQIVAWITVLPLIGDTLQKIVIIILDVIGQFFEHVPRIYVVFSLPILIIFLILYSNLVESRTLRKQQESCWQTLKNGLKFMLRHLNFPKKIASFIYYTFLCLLTDQSTVSLDIPIINDRNIDDAMKKVLGTNYQCYVIRISLMGPQSFSEEIEQLPINIRAEIMATLEKEIKKWQNKFMAKVMFPILEKIVSFRSVTEKSITEYEKRLIKRRNLFLVCGINENGCIAYAIVEVPQPMRITRIISRFWCSDPDIKERIITEIRRLEYR